MTKHSQPTYQQAEQLVFATGSVPDGYMGDRAEVRFALAPTGHVLVVTKHGYYSLHLPQASGVGEALWLLRNHPNARGIKVDAPVGGTS